MTWQWASPVDHCPLERRDDELVSCDGGQRFALRDGIWDLVAPEHREAVTEWATAYGKVRAAEGRTAVGAEYYQSLPWTDVSGRFADQWKIRAASFDRLVALLNSWGPPGALVDVGAGNCWAAARLSQRGWTGLCVDVNVDGHDGLGARHHHGTDLVAARAQMSALPLESASIDVVLFNAALHYAQDTAAAVAEAIRVLRPGGLVVVVDSPLYSDQTAGDSMVIEQERGLAALGCEVPATLGAGYLLESELAAWPESCGGIWHDQTARPARVRAAIGRRRAGRETARLSFVVGTKEHR